MRAKMETLFPVLTRHTPCKSTRTAGAAAEAHGRRAAERAAVFVGAARVRQQRRQRAHARRKRPARQRPRRAVLAVRVEYLPGSHSHSPHLLPYQY